MRRVRRQARDRRLDRRAAIIRQEMQARHEQMGLGLVWLELDRALAESLALAQAPLLAGEAVAEI